MPIHLAENTARSSVTPPHLTTVLDVVIPVHNEQETLAASVRAVHLHLTEQFAYPFRITLADNASTDATLYFVQFAREQVAHVGAGGGACAT